MLIHTLKCSIYSLYMSYFRSKWHLCQLAHRDISAFAILHFTFYTVKLPIFLFNLPSSSEIKSKYLPDNNHYCRYSEPFQRSRTASITWFIEVGAGFQCCTSWYRGELSIRTHPKTQGTPRGVNQTHSPTLPAHTLYCSFMLAPAPQRHGMQDNSGARTSGLAACRQSVSLSVLRNASGDSGQELAGSSGRTGIELLDSPF